VVEVVRIMVRQDPVAMVAMDLLVWVVVQLAYLVGLLLMAEMAVWVEVEEVVDTPLQEVMEVLED
jgi:hypothetical protein